jgi:asparagine synthase (glutamine-hydrolysing)
MDTVLMRHSIEGRSPFLDPRLAEWTQGLPTEDLIGGGVGKVLLRRIVSQTLGESIARRPKQGFGSPIVEWLTGPLRELVLDVLPASGLAADRQRCTVAEFYRRPTVKRAAKVWTLMSLALWERQWANAA